MATAIRYSRLFAYFVRFSFSRALEFRFDFCFRIVMDLFYYAVNLAFYQVIFGHTALLAGWNLGQMRVFVAGYLILDALIMTLISNNFWMLPILVNKGDLDYFLIRPVSSLFFLSLRDFAVNSFMNLVMAAGIFVWALRLYEGDKSPGAIALYILLILNGTYLYYLVRLLSILPVFWTHSARGLESAFWSVSKLSERPDGIYQGWMRRLLTTVLPFALMSSFPARVLFEGPSWDTLGLIVGVTVALSAFTLACWRWGLRSYSSASS